MTTATAASAAPAAPSSQAPKTLLGQVKKGKIQKPHLLIIYGPDGVGKSSFCADAPMPLFMASEDGTNNLDVARLPEVTSFEMIIRGLKEMITDVHPYQSLVIDSLDWMENMIYEAVATEKKVKSIEDIPYGKGYMFALDKWREIMRLLMALRETKGMNILCIAHAKIKKFEDPSTPAGYERYQLKLQTGASTDAAALWREFVDTVLFANYVTEVSGEDKKRGFGDGTRMIYTERRPGFDAKNRLGLPYSLPLSWAEFSEAAAKGEPDSPDQMLREIEGMKAQVKDEELVKKIDKALKTAGRNATQLAEIKNRLNALLGKEG